MAYFMQRTSRYDTSSATLGATPAAHLSVRHQPAHTQKALLQLVRYHYTVNIACNIARTSTSEASGKTPKRLTSLSLSTALS